MTRQRRYVLYCRYYPDIYAVERKKNLTQEGQLNLDLNFCKFLSAEPEIATFITRYQELGLK